MKRAIIVAGMAYGDEGKGATVDFLCRHFDAELVVRYNGGSQCGHNVITPDGRHHTFAQFGSGTFIPGVRTHLSRFMLVNPISMMREEEHLREVGVTDAFERLSVDQNCVIITPFHRALNRIEQIVKGVHSSCGSGVGRARGFSIEHPTWALRVGDLHDPDVVLEKLMVSQTLSFCDARDFLMLGGVGLSKEDVRLLTDPAYAERVAERYAEWYSRVHIGGWRLFREMLDRGAVVFEGAQGVLLDETHGEQGFNTWTNTTFENAFTLLNECGYDGDVMKLGVVRTYFTRHGDGPFPTEFKDLRLPEPHNDDSGYQGKFRVGTFDWAAFERAVTICGEIDGVVVNHLDAKMTFFPGIIGRIAPILLEGYGPTADHRRIMGDWRTRCRKLTASGSQKH